MLRAIRCKYIVFLANTEATFTVSPGNKNLPFYKWQLDSFVQNVFCSTTYESKEQNSASMFSNAFHEVVDFSFCTCW